MSNDLAGSHEYESPGFDPAPQGLPTAAQRDGWAWFLAAIEYAETPAMVARHVAQATGYSLGLRDAGVINVEHWRALTDQLDAQERAATIRLVRAKS